MRKIQMVDLQGQYERIKNEVQASFEEVLNTTAFINGPQVQAFQKELENYMFIWRGSQKRKAAYGKTRPIYKIPLK